MILKNIIESGLSWLQNGISEAKLRTILMKLLLDRQAFFLFISGSPNLSVRARTAIGESSKERFVSAARLREIAIKVKIGKLAPADRLVRLTAGIERSFRCPAISLSSTCERN
jgi:PIN domain nuclease of toxin-antitoxin system